MARGITVKVKGLSQLLRDLDKMPKQIQDGVAGELEAGAKAMVLGAKRDAPGDQGILKGEISYYPTGPLTFTVVSNALYSGYVEFGTKTKVQIPPGLEDVAAEVRAQPNASSLSAKEAIFLWCKRKGVEPKAWYPIYITLMVKGMRAHPFFIKQLNAQEDKIIKNVQNVLNDLD